MRDQWIPLVLSGCTAKPTQLVASVDGCQAALAGVRPIVDARNSELGKRIDRRFAELDGHIDALSAVVSQVQPVMAHG